MTNFEQIDKILDALGISVNTTAHGVQVNLSGVGIVYVGAIPNDLNAIRELELLVIEKFGLYEYGYQIIEHADGLFSRTDTQRAAVFATADATTRISAMLAVIEEGNGGED